METHLVRLRGRVRALVCRPAEVRRRSDPYTSGRACLVRVRVRVRVRARPL